MQDCIGESLLDCRQLGRRFYCRKLHAYSRLADVDCAQADKKSDRSHYLKIDESLEPHPTHLLEVCVARYADYKSAEEQRRYDRFDEAKKDLAQEAQIDGKPGPIIADLGSNYHADQYPCGERSAADCITDQTDDCEPSGNKKDHMRNGKNPVMADCCKHR